MKSYKNLFKKFISYDNLSLAINRSAIRKTRRRDVQNVLQNKDRYIKELQGLLINRTYKTRQHTARIILDGMSKKKRIIIQPDYLYEQIVHHAVVQVLQPIMSKGMYQYSCGSIPNRGGHFGKKYIEKFIRKNKSEIKYVLKLDIRKYFNSIDINILKAKFAKIIQDENMLWIINTVLDSNMVIVEGKEQDVGLPIGYYTSQWFANYFLQDFDHFVKENLKAKCYVRYIDDIVIFGRSKKELHKTFKAIEVYLSGMNLSIKDNWQVFRFDYIARDGKHKGRPLDFVGFKFYRDRTTLRRSILLRATRKAKRISKKERPTWFDCSQMVSYFGWFKHTKTFQIYERFIKPFVNIEVCKKLISKRQQKINKEKENAIRLETERKHTEAA